MQAFVETSRHTVVFVWTRSPKLQGVAVALATGGKARVGELPRRARTLRRLHAMRRSYARLTRARMLRRCADQASAVEQPQVLRKWRPAIKVQGPLHSAVQLFCPTRCAVRASLACIAPLQTPEPRDCWAMASLAKLSMHHTSASIARHLSWHCADTRRHGSSAIRGRSC